MTNRRVGAVGSSETTKALIVTVYIGGCVGTYYRCSCRYYGKRHLLKSSNYSYLNKTKSKEYGGYLTRESWCYLSVSYGRTLIGT